MLKSTHIIFALFFVFWVNSFVFAQSTCAIEGTWSNTTSFSSGNVSTSVENKLDFSESSKGDNYTAGDLTVTTTATFNGCSCSADYTGSYNYSISAQTAHGSNLVCSNNKTSGDCAEDYSCECGTSTTLTLIISSWSSDCDSFTSAGILYEKQSSDWWVWVLIIAVVVVVLVIIALAAVGGYMYYRKRNQYSSYN